MLKFKVSVSFLFRKKKKSKIILWKTPLVPKNYDLMIPSGDLFRGNKEKHLVMPVCCQAGFIWKDITGLFHKRWGAREANIPCAWSSLVFTKDTGQTVLLGLGAHQEAASFSGIAEPCVVCVCVCVLGRGMKMLIYF